MLYNMWVCQLIYIYIRTPAFVNVAALSIYVYLYTHGQNIYGK